jgi:VWFA-related protein
MLSSAIVRRVPASLCDAMTELARQLGEVPGRKVLILLGAEFPDAVTRATRRHHEAMIEALNGSNVAVYALDVTGRGCRPSLEWLARVTGGGYPFHGRDLVEPLREIERENSGFYLLSYPSARPRSERGYRRVEVRTTNPELEARARSGYGDGYDPSN